MKLMPPRQQLRSFVLALALLGLALAVFNWGLQYKISLYQTSGSAAHAPAKLWMGKSTIGRAAVAIEFQQTPLLNGLLPAAILIFAQLFCLASVKPIFCLTILWKLRFRRALSAFSFRPPPALA